MKKYIFIFLLLIITGCGKKEQVVEKKILSKGELVCVYKESRTNENTIYSSYYSFNFDDNGILNGATNVEVIEFDGSLDSVKERYKKEVLEAIKDYEDIKGVKVSETFDSDKYYFTIDMDNTIMDDETKKDYLLDQDRISLYKLFTSEKYTCE